MWVMTKGEVWHKYCTDEGSHSYKKFMEDQRRRRRKRKPICCDACGEHKYTVLDYTNKIHLCDNCKGYFKLIPDWPKPKPYSLEALRGIQ
jgi:hypothetical protein